MRAQGHFGCLKISRHTNLPTRSRFRQDSLSFFNERGIVCSGRVFFLKILTNANLQVLQIVPVLARRDHSEPALA
jgi:hypothetical protein